MSANNEVDADEADVEKNKRKKKVNRDPYKVYHLQSVTPTKCIAYKVYLLQSVLPTECIDFYTNISKY